MFQYVVDIIIIQLNCTNYRYKSCLNILVDIRGSVHTFYKNLDFWLDLR